MNAPRFSDPRQQAQFEARLREEALARAQARLQAENPASLEKMTASAHVQPGISPHPAAAPIAAPHVMPAEPAAQPVKTGDGGLDFIGGERDARDFLRANRHSGKVRFLRIALPLVAVFILFVVIGAYVWSLPGSVEVKMQSAGIENGKMVMKNPELNGVDDKQRPYSLVAREAIQDPADPNAVELNGIDANVPMEDGLFANILAGKGFYNSKAKTLKLDENVDITTDDGVMMKLKDADIDMDAGNLRTASPVSIVSEQAEISAESFSVENNGEKVVFEKRVRMTLYPAKIQEAQKNSETDGAN